ncbi:MAG: hypothetical protein NC253_01360 [Ruminococcus sp.]|nr:hypothetical protein [Ruminococcus sp.]MCM1380927.1 hypothetical protein [Muribaculaceae bacterium]MCM1480480.1 hypothetical protein [Muribaculaceae bacterium]
MRQKEIFLTYLINKRDKLENDIRQLQIRLTKREADAVDCLELALARERLIAFEEYYKEAVAILNLSAPEPVTYVSFRRGLDADYARYRVKLERDKGK